MATIKKKPTKAHKSKKVVKAHMGMAHVPRQRPPRQTRPPKLVNPDQIRIKQPTGSRPLTQPVRIDQPTGRPRPITPKRIDQPTGRPRPITPKRRPIDLGAVISPSLAVKPMDERARRRRDNALKSELDEAVRQANRRPRRPRRPTAQPIRPPLLGTPFSFPQGVMSRPNQSTALTDRFTKQQQELVQAQNQNNLNQNRLQMQRNKGGDVKKYAVGGLNKGMTKSRTKYGIVDNKKK